MHFDYSDSQIPFADSFYADPDYPIDSYLKLMGLLILFGRIGDRGKASCQVLPGGLEKKLHILGIFFLTYYSPFIVYLTHPKASSYH